MTVGPGFFFEFGFDALAGADDGLFVVVGRLGVFGGVEIEVGFADEVFGTEVLAAGKGGADSEETGLGVFEINVVGDVGEVGSEKDAGISVDGGSRCWARTTFRSSW